MRAAAAIVALLASAAGGAAAQDVPLEPGVAWKLTRAVAAPWVAAPVPIAGALRGKAVRFEPGRVVGPHPFGCGEARYEFALVPAEGLFQGSLPAPAPASARRAGIATLPALTLQVACDGGAFDFHLAGPGRLVTALDAVVWTLERTTGAPARTPEAVVARLLVEHFTHDMAFTTASAARKRPWFTPGLNRQIARYFAKPLPEDEPPPINGDPITNTQEYPARFAIGRAAVTGREATVRVAFAGAGRARPVDFMLRRADTAWRIDDLRYEDGATFRAILN